MISCRRDGILCEAIPNGVSIGGERPIRTSWLLAGLLCIIVLGGIVLGVIYHEPLSAKVNGQNIALLVSSTANNGISPTGDHNLPNDCSGAGVAEVLASAQSVYCYKVVVINDGTEAAKDAQVAFEAPRGTTLIKRPAIETFSPVLVGLKVDGGRETEQWRLYDESFRR